MANLIPWAADRSDLILIAPPRTGGPPNCTERPRDDKFNELPSIIATTDCDVLLSRSLICHVFPPNQAILTLTSFSSSRVCDTSVPETGILLGSVTVKRRSTLKTSPPISLPSVSPSRLTLLTRAIKLAVITSIWDISGASTSDLKLARPETRPPCKLSNCLLSPYSSSTTTCEPGRLATKLTDSTLKRSPDTKVACGPESFTRTSTCPLVFSVTSVPINADSSLRTLSR